MSTLRVHLPPRAQIGDCSAPPAHIAAACSPLVHRLHFLSRHSVIVDGVFVAVAPADIAAAVVAAADHIAVAAVDALSPLFGLHDRR